MAAENDQPQASAQPSASDEIISLEDLIAQTETATPTPASSVAVIDKVLEVEDPAFTQELKELKDAGTAPEHDVVIDTDVDHIVEQEKVESASQGWKKIKLFLFKKPARKIADAVLSLKTLGPWLKETVFPAVKAALIKTFQGLKAGLGWFVTRLKLGFGWFGAQPKKSKGLIIAVIVLAVASAVMTRIAIKGRFLPSLEKDFLVSFADGADAAYEFEAGEPWQDLNDPLLHPEHIVLIERLIVNLHAPGDGTNPMALLDLYVEGGTKEVAIEIKDRDSEVRDMVLRTMEQMRYEELATDAGKSKLKIFLRKNLNDMMTKGRVRRLFFKSIVLKP